VPIRASNPFRRSDLSSFLEAGWGGITRAHEQNFEREREREREREGGEGRARQWTALMNFENIIQLRAEKSSSNLDQRETTWSSSISSRRLHGVVERKLKGFSAVANATGAACVISCNRTRSRSFHSGDDRSVALRNALFLPVLACPRLRITPVFPIYALSYSWRIFPVARARAGNDLRRLQIASAKVVVDSIYAAVEFTLKIVSLCVSLCRLDVTCFSNLRHLRLGFA